MDRFWDLFAKSTITQTVLSLGLVGAVIYLSVTGQPVSEILSALAGTAVGFFFGSKLVQSAQSRSK